MDRTLLTIALPLWVALVGVPELAGGGEKHPALAVAYLGAVLVAARVVWLRDNGRLPFQRDEFVIEIDEDDGEVWDEND